MMRKVWNRHGRHTVFLLAWTGAIGMLPLLKAGAQDIPPNGQRAPTRAFRSLMVTGHGEVQVKPDKADVTIGVVTQSTTSQEAVSANAAASQKVQAAVRQLGIQDRDIQTVNYTVQPLMAGGYGTNQKPTISGYQVTNSVRVTIRDLSRVGAVIDAAAAAGSNTIEDISFGIANRQPRTDAALAQAVADARRKADTLARAAGVTIVGVYEIDEGMPSRGPIPLARGVMAAAAATPVAPGELTVPADVTVIYEITSPARTSRK
ncbi:MAG TPA: SIMPL domain-containing protein [Chthonomonadaceae bacterium]|nr:SIMPL domain-containing protein [Chthonomonadaceae bacterium]